jgi:hypothetical protein
MTTPLMQELRNLATVDLFGEVASDQNFVGRPFYLDFDQLRLLSNDSWKQRVGGVPAGAFLLCVYTGEPDIHEALLLRVLRTTKLPTDSDVVAAMVDFYKESVPEQEERLDSYTRAEFQFSGLECRVLGTFYRDAQGATQFAGDLDNFYAPNNYRVYKPVGRVLEYIVNYRDDGLLGDVGDTRIGAVRYSSSLRHVTGEGAPVYISPFDFLGKRTALFGMTRTGKSNSVKKIIQAVSAIAGSDAQIDGRPVGPIGQIIFDVNGEYANENQQDAGTAIFAQFRENVTRYSVEPKPDFRVMKLNFYDSVVDGFNLLSTLLSDDSAIYTQAFCNVDWTPPPDGDRGALVRYNRKVAAYRCCLFAAGFRPPAGTTFSFETHALIRGSGIPALGADTRRGLSPEDAVRWFTAAWDNYQDAGGPFRQYLAQNNGREWAEEDLLTLMRFLSRSARPGAAKNEAGFRKLIPHRQLHTDTVGQPFEEEIVGLLRAGQIIIIDLSQGDPMIQNMYSERVCKRIFNDAMRRFTRNETNNFIQLYFEEAHNLFPKRDEQNLTLIYNRLAKEGQKVRLGLCYATQEVSSISSSILKNTQNWFVSHLNNRDELREVAKFYDFEDFTESLRRTTDKGFIRLKTDSNTFIVPIQVDRFVVNG